MATNTRFKITADVLMQRLGDETVFLKSATEGYYTLDDVGTAMLNALLATEDMAQAVTQVAAEYAADVEQVRIDLVQILDDLVAAGILAVEA